MPYDSAPKQMLYIKPQWNQIMVLTESGRVGIFQIQVNESWVGLNFNFKKIEQQEMYEEDSPHPPLDPSQEIHLDLDPNDLTNTLNLLRRHNWDLAIVL